MNLVLANRVYETHMTDEGLQLQQGLEHAGWQLSGPGYDQLSDTRELLRLYRPERVFVQDKRDWDPSSKCPGATKDTRFRYLGALARYKGSVSIVVKDAGPDAAVFHHRLCEETNPDAVVIYYHPLSVLKHSPFLRDYPLVRTYHSLNPRDIPAFTPGNRRRSLCGSGAVADDVYPLRARVSKKPEQFGMHWLRHPGYRNFSGSATPHYLRFLNTYKVSFATASSYGFALRKIIEAVACGCTPVTDLPKYDVLPEIDRALFRIKPNLPDKDLKIAFSEAVSGWNEEGRRKWARIAQETYDYRVAGSALSHALKKV